MIKDFATLKLQIKQIGSRSHVHQIHWRALGRAFFFALLLTQPVWANLFNCCEPLLETTSTIAQKAHPACHTSAEALPNSVAKTKSPPATAKVVMCCPMPQSATEGVTLLTPNQTVLPNTLTSVVYYVLTTTAVIPGGKSPPPPLQRPLYLALSCWLI